MAVYDNLDWTVTNDAAAFKTTYTDYFATANDVFASYLSGLRDLMSQAAARITVFGAPGLCKNVISEGDYTVFYMALASHYTSAATAQCGVDVLAADIAALNTGTGAGLYALKLRTTNNLFCSRNVHDVHLAYLQDKLDLLKQDHDERCVGRVNLVLLANEVPPPANEDGTCELQKKVLSDRLYGPTGYDEEIKMYFTKFAESFRLAEAAWKYCLANGATACAAAYAAILDAMNLIIKNRLFRLMTQHRQLADAIKSIDCSAANWQTKVAAAHVCLTALEATLKDFWDAMLVGPGFLASLRAAMAVDCIVPGLEPPSSITRRPRYQPGIIMLPAFPLPDITELPPPGYKPRK